MNRIDQLLENYRSHIQMPLRPGLPSSQRVWFAVYPAAEERRLTNRIDEFEMLTEGSWPSLGQNRLERHPGPVACIGR